MGDMEEWILSRVGQKSRFKFPDNTEREGKLLDRVVQPSPSLPKRIVDYWDVIDLLKIDGHLMIRFAYYKRPRGKFKGRLLWAGQYALYDHIETLKKLFSKAAREKAWFRKFLEDSLEKAKK